MIRVKTKTKFHLGRRGTIILCSFLGIVLLLMGIIFLSNSVELDKNGISAEAQVTNIKTNRIGSKTNYTPEVTFTTAKGETITVQLNKTTGSPAYSVGDKISIIYSPDNPKKIVVDTFFNKYGLPVIVLAGGIVCLVLGVLKIIRKV